MSFSQFMSYLKSFNLVQVLGLSTSLNSAFQHFFSVNIAIF